MNLLHKAAWADSTARSTADCVTDAKDDGAESAAATYENDRDAASKSPGLHFVLISRPFHFCRNTKKPHLSPDHGDVRLRRRWLGITVI